MLLTAYVSYEATASDDGMTGVTNKSGGSGCSCHGGSGSSTSVTIATAASTFYAGQSYDFTVTVANSNQSGAGVNVAASSGTLTAGTGLKVSNGELTHTQPKVGLPAQWSFSWTAPAATGNYTLYATGNAVNLNGGSTGDIWNHGSNYSITVVAAPEKKIALGKTTINLGSIRVGRNRQDTVRIHSNGDATLTISSTAMKVGTHFSRTPTGTNRTLAAGTSEVNTITFAPTAKGSFVDSLIINSDATLASDRRKTIYVFGTGTQGVFSGASSVPFGNTRVGTTSRKGYVVTNTGDDSLFLNNATISGAGFTIAAQPTRLGLAAGEKDSVVVEFDPTAKQAYNGTLTLTAQSGVTVPSIALSGNGIAPVISAPATTDLGGIRIGLSTSGQLTIRNTGNDILTISNVALTGGTTSRFSLSGSTSFSLPADAEQSVTVNYTPDDETPDQAQITITSNSLTNPTLVVNVSGTGLMPRMSLANAPDTVDFGAVRVSNTATQSFIVNNAGSDVLNLSSVTITAPFTVVSRPSTIDPQSQGEVEIKFAPTATGDFVTMIVVNSDDPANGSDTLYARGTGVNSALNVPANHEFGQSKVGVEVVQTIELKNEGTAPVTIYSYKLPAGTAFRLTDTTKHTIAANSSITIGVAFKPTVAGPASAQLTITTDDGAAPSRIVTLSGVGTQGVLSVDPSSLDFGVVDSGTSSTERMITITNNGTAPVSITGLPTSTCGASFTINPGSEPVLAPGASTQIGVIFTPKAAGVVQCSVSVPVSEGPAIVVMLRGEGKGKTGGTGSVRDNSPIAGFKLHVSPNPMRQNASITLTMRASADLAIDMYDANGRFVMLVAHDRFHVGQNTVSLNVAGLASGEYFLRAMSNGQPAGEAKIIVQH